MLDEVVPADRQFDDPIIREGRLARPTVGHTSEATVLVEHELTFCGEEDGIRDPLWSRGLGDVYKRQSPQKVSSCSTRTVASDV